MVIKIENAPPHYRRMVGKFCRRHRETARDGADGRGHRLWPSRESISANQFDARIPMDVLVRHDVIHGEKCRSAINQGAVAPDPPGRAMGLRSYGKLFFRF
jgi:hypothetical protein